MLTIEKVDTNNKAQVNRFVRFHYDLYKNCPQWVPPIIGDIKLMLNPEKHPYFEHSVAEYYIAVKDGKDVGRIAVHENCPFNAVHQAHDAEFYLFDSIDDQEVANALFERSFEWSKNRGLTRMVGPKGFSPFDGYGIQTEGFELRQMMTMMNYNYAYYPQLMETLGFSKEVDFVSCYLARDGFTLPEKANIIAQKVQEKGTFKVVNFENKKQLSAWAKRIGQAYNKTFVNNWEYYPLTDREIKFTLDTLLTVADPRLIKIITHNDDVVGFLLGFPDLSMALQRAKGHINPVSIVDLMLEMKRTKWVSLNGVGMLPEYHGRGGAALMYSEMVKTIQTYSFEHAELTQVSNTAVQMRQDLINLGGKPYKNHRVYQRTI
jgi:hypothetical protein